MPDPAGKRRTSEAALESSSASLDELSGTLAELEIIEPSEFNSLAAEAQGSMSRLLETLRRHGFLSPFQIARIKEAGPRSLRFDDYALLDKLGEGGAGEVFKARNLVLGRLEAIKIIQTDGPQNDSVTRRFQREARVLAQLEHPGIVPIHKIGRFRDADYIAMKFVEGKTLQKRIDEANHGGLAIPVATACKWVMETADALDYAHREAIVHRDIKPGNLMVTLSGRIMVLDMGLARITDPDCNKDLLLTGKARGMGTPEYMPPEQWADATAVCPASDVYSLGCTLVHLLTGRPPYSGRMNELLLAHATGPIPKIRDRRRDVPKQLDAVIAQMLAKKPAERLPSGRAVIEAIEPIHSKLPADGRSVPSVSIDASKMDTARAVGGGQPTQPDTSMPFVSIPATTSWNVDVRKQKSWVALAPIFWLALAATMALGAWLVFGK